MNPTHITTNELRVGDRLIMDNGEPSSWSVTKIGRTYVHFFNPALAASGHGRTGDARELRNSAESWIVLR